MINIFLEKQYTKSGGEASQRPFYKRSKSLHKYSEMLHSLFILYVQVEVYQNILKTRYWPVALALYKAFSKTNKRSKTIFLTSLSAWLLKKSVSQVIFYQLTWFNCLLFFTSWDFGQYVYCNYLLAILWRHKFWI